VVAWVLAVLLVPIAGASLGLLYGVYLAVTTGSLNTVAKGFRASSRTISFAESPIWFSCFVLLNALLAAAFIVGTWALARLVYRFLRHGDTGQGSGPPRVG
jgi:hypothetical protein